MAYGAHRTRPRGVPVDLPGTLNQLLVKLSLRAAEQGPDLVERPAADAPMSSPIPLSRLQVPNFQTPRASSPQTGTGR